MDARELKGMEIAARLRIVRQGDGNCWSVPSSQSGGGKYVVDLDAATCTCDDFTLRAKPCKHIFAARIVAQQETDGEAGATIDEPDNTPIVVKRLTFAQDWPNYNLAQNNEKDHFQELLAGLCGGIAEPAPKGGKKGGRPTVPLRDAAFSVIYKVYCGMSARRFVYDLTAAHELGYLLKPISHNSVLKAMDSAALTPILQDLIRTSARPLSEVESYFAPDSTGFCTTRYTRWIDVKYGIPREEVDWVKVHIMTGVKTNVVTAAEIHDKNTNDCNILPSLTETTAKGFTIKEMSADKAYAANPNFEAVERHGGTLYAPFRKNTTGGVGGLYEKMFHLFCLNRDDYLKHYHRRSNVESTFSAVKRKFGEAVRSKTDTAQANEVYCKLICQNICCLIHAMYELGVAPPSWGRETEAERAVLKFPGA